MNKSINKSINKNIFRGFLLLIAGIFSVLTIFISVNKNVVATGIIDVNSQTPSFFDDFESYKAFDENGYDPKQLNVNWDNEYIDLDENNSNDTDCASDRFFIKDDGDNKVLHINNKPPINGSFYYIAPKDIRTKDFELTFRVKPFHLGGSWFGVCVRKSYNLRYNNCDNVMLVFRLLDNDFEESVPQNAQRVCFEVQRSVVGSLQNETAKIKSPLSDPELYPNAQNVENNVPIYYEYDPDNANNTATPVLNEWHEVKVSVKGNYFRAYFDDIYLGWYFNDKEISNQYGFVSLNACVTDIYIDDVYLNNLDTQAAPPLVPRENVGGNDTDDTEPNNEENDDLGKSCFSVVFPFYSTVPLFSIAIFYLLKRRTII